MKTFDVLSSGISAAKAAVQKAAAAVAGRAPKLSREAQEELRRRAEVNARADAARAEQEAAIFGTSRWLPRRPGWLERR